MAEKAKIKEELKKEENCRDCTKYNLLENETIYRIYTKAKDNYE